MLRRSLHAMLACLITALALILSPLTSPALAVDEETSLSIPVEVTVSDEDGYTGEVTPIEGVEITLYRWDETASWLAIDRELPSTDGSGQASFEVTEVGDFTLGYVDPSGEHAPSYGVGRRSLDEIEPGAIGTFAHDGSGEGGLVLDARMPRVFEPDPEVEDAEVVGLVLDEDGQPIPYVKVEAIVVESQDPEQTRASRAVPGELEEGDQVAYTDWTNDHTQNGNHEPRGGYRLILPPGDYRILFTREDEDTSYFYGDQAPEIVTVEAGRHYELPDSVLPDMPETATAILTGMVVDAVGGGVADRYVDLYRMRQNQNYVYLGTEYTDSSGQVVFPNAPAGKSLVACSRTANYRTVCGDGRRSVWDAEADTFTIPEGVEEFVAVAPLVVDPTSDVTVPVVDARGQAMSLSGSYVRLVDEETGEQWGGFPDAEGNVLIRGVFPGEYQVCASLYYEYCYAGSGVPAVQGRQDAVSLTVPGEVLSYRTDDLRLPVRGTFSGRVTDPDGVGVPSLEVSVRQRNEEANFYQYRYATTTDAQGGYEAYFFEPGDYLVCVRLIGRGTEQCAGADEEFPGGRPISVESDDVALAVPEFTTPATVRLEGRVLDMDGQAVRYPYLALYTQPRNEGDSYFPYVGSASGNQDGTYSIPVFPGEEPLTVCTNRNGLYACLGGTTSASDSGTQFVLVDGQQDPVTVEDLTLDYRNSVHCTPGETASYGDGAVVDNGTLAMGVACLADHAVYQEGFDEIDRSDWVGLRLAGKPDAITQGCWCGGWGVADASSGMSAFASYHYGYGNVRLDSFSTSEDGITAASTVSAGQYWSGDGATFQVTHETLPSDSPNAYLVRVSIANVSDDVADLRYRRTVDWDVAPTAFDEIITSSTGNLPEIAFSSNDGFASPDPLARRDSRGAAGDFRYGPKDQGTLIDFDFGQLMSSETRTFTLAFGGAASEAEAHSILEALNAKAYSMATASDEDNDTSYFLAYGVDDEGATQIPVANADKASVPAGGSVVVDVLANDVANADGDLVVVSASGAQHGDVSCDSTSCTYRHGGGTATSDSFRYTIRNSAGQTALGRVDVSITEAPPVAVVDTVPVIEPADDLVEGDEVTVTPATYTDVNATTTSSSFEWFLEYGANSTYRFATGSQTKVTIPSWAAGARVFVKETLKASGYTSVTSTSESTEVVQDVPEVYATAWPELDKAPKEGLALTPVGVEWSVEPDAVTYTWYVGGTKVNEGDERLTDGGRAFTPGAADVGNWVEVELLATKADHNPGYAWAWGSRIRGKDEKLRVLGVSVVDPDEDPITDASVSICSSQECVGVRLVDGVFQSEVPTTAGGVDYQVYVYPYSGGLLGAAKTVKVENGDEPKTATVTLERIKKTPPSVTFPDTTPSNRPGDDGVPMGFVGQELSAFTATGCTPVDNPTWTVTFANGAEPMTGTVAAEDVEVEPGTDPETVSYTVRIPELTSSGYATIETNFDCDGPISFTIYIDPSGYVTDQFGRTIAGAEVTLLRDMGAGQFGPVADGDVAVMDPAVNDSNPSLTDATGFFRWDVAAGDYRVSVTDATSGGATCAVVTTPTMTVPPERVDLVVKTECAGATTPTPTTVPQVTGVREVGRVLTMTDGAWANGIRQTGIQWLRDGTPIAGATGNSYTLVADDAGHAVTARVTAQRPDYAQENGSGAVVGFTAFTTPATGGGAVVTPNPGGGGGGGGGNPTPTPTITNTAKPAITGDAVVGRALAASQGRWSTDGLTFAYQWLRDGEPIEGATAAEYTPVVADLGKAVSVKVTATKSGFTPGTATSDPVTVESGAAPQSSAAPEITGTPELGETLTVSDGEWDLEDLTFAYQWLRDGEAIEGATEATYVVTEDDLGTELAAEITASKDGHEDGSATSEPVAVPEVVEPVESTTKARLLGKKVKQGNRGQVKVRVLTEAEEAPTGTVTVTAGKKSVEVELTEADNGTLKIRLPKLKPGKHEVSVEYSGDDATLASSDDAGTLKVTKKSKGKKGKGKNKSKAQGERTGGGRPLPSLL